MKRPKPSRTLFSLFDSGRGMSWLLTWLQTSTLHGACLLDSEVDGTIWLNSQRGQAQKHEVTVIISGAPHLDGFLVVLDHFAPQIHCSLTNRALSNWMQFSKPHFCWSRLNNPISGGAKDCQEDNFHGMVPASDPDEIYVQFCLDQTTGPHCSFVLETVEVKTWPQILQRP